MATYKKRGTKKKKINKDDLSYLAKESTTAEVFTSLDEGANKIEKFLEKNQKWIFSGLFAVIVLIAGYMWYDSNVIQPKEQKAIDEMVTAQKYFDMAMNDVDEKKMNEDFEKALNGADGKYGFKQIESKYGNTKAGNLAHYYLGTIYYKQGNFKDAVSELSKFKADDDVLQPAAFGMIGDAFMQLEQPKDALEYYEKAANYAKNEFTTPRYLLKAGQVALELRNKDKAKKYFERIKEEFKNSNEARNIEVFLAKASH